MNKYWILALVATWLACGAGGWQARGWKDGVTDAKHDEAQQDNTIAAQTKVIATIKTEETINEKATESYEKDAHDIGALYDERVQSTPASAINDLRTVPAAAPGTHAVVCQAVSRKYKLTFKQCDQEEAAFNALWNDWKSQATGN